MKYCSKCYVCMKLYAVFAIEYYGVEVTMNKEL